MAMAGFTKDMNIIQQLNDEPNDRDGLTAGELKAKFDEGGLALKDYLNNTVKPYVEGMEGTEAAHEADTVRHITAAERMAWNGKYDKTGGVLTGNVTVQPTGAPMLTLSAPEKSGTGRSKTVLQKNAGASADYGTQLIDYTWGDGTTANQRTILRVLSATVLADRLMLIDYAAGGDYVMYHLYGEHNPPGVGSVTGLAAALDGKVDKVTGKGLSTNDYTTAEKNKLAGIAAGAQVNSITGVKGNAESSYRTGDVNLTPANLGAAPASHSHDYLPLAGGTLTGDLTVQKNAPRLKLAGAEKTGTGRARTELYKNAGESVDYGTFLTDLAWGDGSDGQKKTILILRTASPTLKGRLVFSDKDGNGGSTDYYLYGEHNPPAVADVDGLQTALSGKSDTGHTHNYLPLSGGTLTGNLTLDPTGASAPQFVLFTANGTDGPGKLMLFKNASASVDYGTQLADFVWGDGGATTAKNVRITLRAAATALDSMLTLHVNEGTGGSATVYKLYGEHNKPSAEDIVDGILPTARGGTGNSTGYVTAGQKSDTVLGDYATAEGYQNTAAGDYSHAEGYGTKSTGWGYGSHAEGINTYAYGYFTHAEGVNTYAASEEPGVSSIQDLGGAHAEGFGTSAGGEQSHAEGKNTSTAGIAAHAEGKESSAGGEASHAEGMNTDAVGTASHAEGYRCQAIGNFSHAEGMYTIASGNDQHVFGKYNKPDTTSVEIVGWGTGTATSDRKNIRTLDTNGNMTIAGTLTQASDARLKDVGGEIPDVSGIRAVRFKWNDVNGEHDEKDHIGYIAQEVEAVAPYLVGEDSNGYKSLDYIALLCAKVEMLERQVRDLTEKLEGGD